MHFTETAICYKVKSNLSEGELLELLDLEYEEWMDFNELPTGVAATQAHGRSAIPTCDPTFDCSIRLSSSCRSNSNAERRSSGIM